MNTPTPDPPALETDPRFPSGEWRGFWLQRSLYANRRQQMELLLTFAAGRLTGEGRDLLDDFTIAGDYDLDSGEVTWKKTHLTRGYGVFYKGYAENKGIWGLWHLPGDRDGFHIWPKGTPDPTGDHLAAETEVLVVEEVSAAGRK